jgi:hypothetical protein
MSPSTTTPTGDVRCGPLAPSIAPLNRACTAPPPTKISPRPPVPIFFTPKITQFPPPPPIATPHSLIRSPQKSLESLRTSNQPQQNQTLTRVSDLHTCANFSDLSPPSPISPPQVPPASHPLRDALSLPSRPHPRVETGTPCCFAYPRPHSAFRIQNSAFPPSPPSPIL